VVPRMPIPPWLWSEGMLQAFWPVCKFDLILTIPSVLTNIIARYMPLFECINILSQKNNTLRHTFTYIQGYHTFLISKICPCFEVLGLRKFDCPYF